MFKKAFSLLTLMMAVAAWANANSLYLGYCNGQIANEGTGKAGECKMSACLRIDAATLLPYKGAQISAVRVGLVTADGVKNLTGWVRDINDGANLDSGTASQAVNGWNRVALEGKLTITGDKPLYVGFDYNQSRSVKAISVVGDEREEGFILARNDEWEIPRNPVGTLSVELEITGDNLPSSDLTVASLVATPNLLQAGTPIKATFEIQNAALTMVPSFSYACYFNGEKISEGSSSNPLNYGDAFDGSFEINTTNLEGNKNYPVKVVVTSDGDSNSANDAREIYVAVYDHCYQRVTLLEEFTTEMCPQCPRATDAIRQFMNSDLAPVLAPVAHHAGFYTDPLTTDLDKSLLWLFGGNSYAPAAMLDRTSPDGYGVPVQNFGYYTDMLPKVTAATQVPAFVKVDIVASIDRSTRKLKVKAVSEKNIALDVLCPSPLINIWLTEDKIKPQGPQGQAGNTDPDYLHRHVFRRSFTGVWGQEMTWDGYLSASKEYTLTIPQSWDLDNVEIVAFVSEKDPISRTLCKVYNARRSGLEGSGINELVASHGQALCTEIYDLQGRRMAQPLPGQMVIERTIFTDGTSSCTKKIF